MQAQRHSEYWGDNSNPSVLLNSNGNYSFTGIKGGFFDILPTDIESLMKVKKEQTSNIFKNRGRIYLYNSTINQLFQILVFIQIFGKGL